MSTQYIKRSDSTQLPSAIELLDILTKESQRKAVRFDFIQKNDAIFEPYRHLTTRAKGDASWLTQYADLPLDTLVEKISMNHALLAQHIQTSPQDQELFIKLYQALIPQDDLSPSEAIFVFGAASNARIQRAVELYHANKIIISGNSPHYVEGAQSEASRMAAYAREQGIPDEHLMLEEASVTLPDNVKRTIDLMESVNWRPTSLTIVATNFVLTRARMEWYKFCPWDIEIKPVSAHPQSEKFTAEGWFKHEDAVALVLNEYAKLILESRIDLMRRDGDIR